MSDPEKKAQVKTKPKLFGQAKIDNRKFGSLQKIKDRAQPPEGCSPTIINAPARGTIWKHRPSEAVLTENGVRFQSMTEAGFDAVKVASPLDVMEDQSKRSRGKKYQPLFNNVHHSAAAAYSALFERVNSGRVKCSSLDGSTGGGSSNRSVMDAIIADIQRFDRMRAVLGKRLALQNIGQMAHADRGRKAIAYADLVHAVCVREWSLTDILKGHGWAVQHRYRIKLQASLMTALADLYGL